MILLQILQTPISVELEVDTRDDDSISVNASYDILSDIILRLIYESQNESKITILTGIHTPT